MAFRISKPKPVEFDEDFKLTPKVPTELKLRLQKIKFETEDDVTDGIDLFSRCFGSDNEERVKKFLTENANMGVLYQLQMYLAFGEETLKSYNESVGKAATKEAKSES